ncbi:MAG: DUF309 domain-containing protein, partial [Campylobacterales bacterium]|nr:DUF309 domain-containing protein [Campylobacterales bacterium]
MLNATVTKALEEFEGLLEHKLYFEAHEVLELLWIEAKKYNHPQTLLIKGLINAAVAFEHLKRNRPNALKSSRITIQAYKRYRHHLQPNIANFTHYKK